MTALGNKQADLVRLLRYAKELLVINAQVISDIDVLKFPRFYEWQLSGLEGIGFQLSDDIWISMRRIKETNPPDLDSILTDWVLQERHPSPDKQPLLKKERIVKMSKDAVDSMVQAGKLDPLDILLSEESVISSQELSVIQRSSGIPEVQTAWNSYITGPWASWSEIERPRRRSIHIYNVFYQIHQQIVSMGADNPIELVFGLGMARWQPETGRISAPIIEQLLETELQGDGTLQLRPRSSDPALNLKPFHAAEIFGSKQLQIDASEHLARTVKDPDVGFSPANLHSYEQVLRMCSTRLSSSGVYLSDDQDFDRLKSLPSPDSILKVADTWVVYVRQRQENAREQDFENLIGNVHKVSSEEQLPAAAMRFVEPPSEFAVDDGPSMVDLSNTSINLPSSTSISGVSSGSAPISSGETGSANTVSNAPETTYFFPLPFNEDQVKIAQLLEAQEGVLVQGPPGTGKTHTIANIICHYLATGKRVLVTAKTPEALTALQGKIPEQIRGLAISVIHNDREGNSQLERAVTLLSDEIKGLRRDELERDIISRQARLVEINLAIKLIDSKLEEIANKNHQSVIYKNQVLTPMALAKAIFSENGQYKWFDDPITLEEKFQPKFTNADISEIRTLRQQLDADVIYNIPALSSLTKLPDLPKVLAAHTELARISHIDGKTNDGQLPPISDLPNGMAIAKEMAAWLKGFKEFFENTRKEEWIVVAYQKFIGFKKTEAANASALKRGIAQWIELANKGKALKLKAIVLDMPSENVGAYDRAIDDLAIGKEPFGIFSFFQGGLKAALDSVFIEGRKPSGRADWSVIQAYRNWQKAVINFALQWNALCPVLETRALPSGFDVTAADLIKLSDSLKSSVEYAAEFEARKKAIKGLFPFGVDVNSILQDGKCCLVLEALQLNVERASLVSAKSLKDELKKLSALANLPVLGAIQECSSNLGNASISSNDIARAWKKIASEAERLQHKISSLVRLENLVKKIADSGAPKWSNRLRWEIVGSDETISYTPLNWIDAWEWVRGAAHVRALSDRKTSQQLNAERKIKEDEKRKLFLEIVRLRTFLGLKKRIVPKIDAALAKFVAAINRLGKGTGVSAGKFRRLIRESAAEAADAVPCWIMPEWRISEQLPPDLAVFDLAVIDESSQSDITALPAIMRAKKVLIVGDDKQVSPTPIGIEAKKVTQLALTYLSGLPFKDQMDPATSLYELGGMIFPGKTVMLREHFRCVEPIIRFSSKFYPKPLIPLRIPKASERLNPPLIDMYVPFGIRDGRKRNRAEAEVIVSEIAKVVADPQFSKRSIGVISLLGHEQARLIYEMLLVEVGTEAMDRHHIMCGDAATFQGQERDIVYLSMVASSGNAISQTARLYEQRYNVAMSRARDRLVLVRSVAVSQLKPGDLKLQVIEHFRNPMEQSNVVQSADILSVCDSDFEREVGKRLLDLGYRIIPQYPISGYRIDFVIEGDDDRRLAVELDGDKYHGPDRWVADMARQRSLERMNWRFWRCWGSAWLADPEGCLADLVGALKRMSIEPIGAAPLAGVYTHHIEVQAPVPEEVVGTNIQLVEKPSDLVDSGDTSAIGVGDLVTLSYADEPAKLLRYRLIDGPNDLAGGFLSIHAPLGVALLGSLEEDEIAVHINGKGRQVLISKVDKKILSSAIVT